MILWSRPQPTEDLGRRCVTPLGNWRVLTSAGREGAVLISCQRPPTGIGRPSVADSDLSHPSQDGGPERCHRWQPARQGHSDPPGTGSCQGGTCSMRHVTRTHHRAACHGLEKNPRPACIAPVNKSTRTVSHRAVNYSVTCHVSRFHATHLKKDGLGPAEICITDTLSCSVLT